MAPRGRPAAAATMPRRGARKRLKFRADDVCSERVTVADYANSDPAVVKSGRVKKAVANAVQQEVKSLCGLEASCVPTEEVLSVSGESCDSSDEMDTKESINGRAASRKKKSKRHKDAEAGGGEEYPIDIWLLLASYIRPEDIVRFSLICKKAWTVTCTAAFWTRLYRRHYSLDAYLPLRLRPESMEKLHCLRACVIRSLFHMYEPFAARLSRNPAIPDSTPSTLKNSRCLLFWCKKIVGNRQEAMWEFNFKFKKQSPRFKSKCCKGLQPPIQYEEVHTNPDQDCCLLQITTFNFIFVPIVMGMTFTLFSISVSTDMRHHRVRLVFQDTPVRNGKKPRVEQGVQVVLDPVHSVRLLDWWHPQYPFSPKA
ncbi:transmembrane protein 183A isoform X2 [Corvus cornix cornix]|uniref:transmembrane protein 183A isoform X2 n=1 Tax=Corvus moneduloides TaxID=1196302 RepID=UPI001363BF5C|nr:transmembrane protein 183A isoform X2 [Corvus moneduloides]XP_039421188.1 transmembrane protein 183A isoform X2 [Corvus cornix cornix]XP_041871859.1 transmembrane protein 183A isoform X2 [Corvus kubaryi]XP_048183819.1 transmembrane protein 183A isoform X2 [Corvus hawaiiensis]